MYDTSIRVNFGRSPSRTRLALGSALSGSLAMMIFAIPGTALAANECGLVPLITGTVTCVPATNPNVTGIAYINPPADLTIDLQDGVRIDTTGTPNIGLVAVSNNVLVVNGGTNTVITTGTVGSHGALVTTNLAPLSLTLDRIATTGANANGVVATSVAGAVSVNTNTITTVGAGAVGISAASDTGPITITFGAINTIGAAATGIRASSGNGAILVTSGPISTIGADADAINVASTGGTATVDVTGNITTQGANSRGIYARADSDQSGS